MRSAIAVLGLCLCISSSVLSLYAADTKVAQLTAADFKQKVINSPGIWLVEFYAPWCGHCKSLAPEWEKAARALEGIVNIGAVDMTKEGQAGASYNIQGYPTIKVFGLNKGSPVDYSGGRDASAIINFALEQAKQAALSRAGGNAGGSRSNSGNQNTGSGSGSTGGSSGDVVTLTNSNFNSQVYGAKGVWLVEFYAPWCGHCKQLQPNWEAAASKLKGKVQLGKVNCDEEQSLCQNFGVRGYPTIKYFKPAASSPSDAQEYQGGRDEQGIIAYASELFMKFGGDLEVTHITSQEILDKECLKSDKNACFVFFLPHILDSSPAERKKTLNDISTVMKEFISYPMTFLWSQGGDQFDLEQQFPLGAGYPALLTIVPKKKKYSVMRTGQGFEPANIKNYINRLLAGSEGIYDLPAVITPVKKVAEWKADTK